MNFPSDDPGWIEYRKHFIEHVAPEIVSSAVTISLVPDDMQPDVQFATELGYSIMLDKPIIAVVEPGAHPPDHLIRCSDAIIESHPDPAVMAARLNQAMKGLNL